MKVVLLGYMASGKSTIGKKLAKTFSLPFIDLDDYIVSKENKTISKIFAEKGEIYFRKIESVYLQEILKGKGNFVLSLGGGTPCYANNMNLINTSDAISIYLHTGIQLLSKRLIAKKSERPLVANLEDDSIYEFVGKHLFERGFFYEQAKYIVRTDGKKMKEVLTEIEMLLY